MPTTRASEHHEAMVMLVAVLAERVRRDQAELALALENAYDSGASLRSLAVAAGISHEQVRRIVYHEQQDTAPGTRTHRHIV